MRSSTRPAARASIPATRAGSTAPAASGRWGDGQVDFSGIFSKLAQYGYESWAVLEWECCLKHPEQGAAEGAPFIQHHIIQVTEQAFDDFAGGAVDRAQIRAMLGLK